MGSGGGGTSTTGAEHSPEMRQLQQAALPQIQSMLRFNPLSNYAGWNPREIAGSNPSYEMLFGQTSQMGPALSGLDLIFGGGSPQGGGGTASLPAPSGGTSGGAGSGAGSIGTGSIKPPPSQQFQPMNIQDIVQQQVAQAVQSSLGPTIENTIQQLPTWQSNITHPSYMDPDGAPIVWQPQYNSYQNLNTGMLGMPTTPNGPLSNDSWAPLV